MSAEGLTLPSVLPLIGLDGIVLAQGGHERREQAVCAMERKRRKNGTFAPIPIEVRLWGRTAAGASGSARQGQCWPYLGERNEDGYGILRHRGRMQGAHRIAWELVNDAIPRGLCVCHSCDNPSCVNSSHLFLGSIADNNRDRARKHRSADVRGQRSPKAKLSRDQAAEIKRRRAAGETITALAAEFHVHHGTISRIAKGQTWTEL